MLRLAHAAWNGGRAPRPVDPSNAARGPASRCGRKEELGAQLGYADYDTPERKSFSQQLTIIEVGGLSLMRASGSAVDIHRSVPSGLKEADIYPLHLLLKLGGGATLCEQQRRSTIVQSDECVLIDSDQPLRLRSASAPIRGRRHGGIRHGRADDEIVRRRRSNAQATTQDTAS